MIEVLKKGVDISLLTDGITLPIDIGSEFTNYGDHYLSRGEFKLVTIIFEGVPYEVRALNINNSRDKRKRDQFQLRYSGNKAFLSALQSTFHSSYSFLQKARGVVEKGTKRPMKLPIEQREYLVLYKTGKPDVFEAEAICTDGMADLVAHNYSEVYLETLLSVDMTDPNATVQEKVAVQRIRRLDRTIADSLKILYGYRCQICGQLVGAQYGAHCCESHHIEYFSKSWNNDSSNQMILCPSHHRIIHSVEPVFNWSNLSFSYRNGMVERLELNSHLEARN